MQANKGFVHVLPDISTCLSNKPTVLTLCETFIANSTITSYAVAKSAWPTDINSTFTNHNDHCRDKKNMIKIKDSTPL